MELGFSEKYSKRTRGNGQKLQEQKLQLDIREKNLPRRVAALE